MKFPKPLSLIALLIMVVVALQVWATLQASPENNVSPNRQYAVVENLGRGASLVKYDSLFNVMATDGWEFDQWLYRGSGQTPDLIFKRK